MKASQKKSGQYLGTKIEQKWPKRFTEAGFPARGNGEYWITDGTLFFQRDASQQPICLPLKNVVEIKVCPCRDSTGGIPIIKLVWEKDGRWLSSGFVLSGMLDKNNNLLACLRSEDLNS